MSGLVLPAEPTVEVHRPATDVALVVLGGEHDLYSAPELRRAFDETLELSAHTVVDLGAVTFLDSTIVAALVRAKKQTEAGGKRFNIVLGAAAPVRRTLETSGTLALLNPVASVDHAVAANAA